MVRITTSRRDRGRSAAHRPPLHHRSIVRVGDHRALGVGLVGLADHAEERARLGLAVDDPLRIEDLVAAVLRVGLGEHGQLDVGGVASSLLEVGEEVVDLVGRQGETQVGVGDSRWPCAPAPGRRSPRGAWVPRDGRALSASSRRRKHRLRHPVVQERKEGVEALRPAHVEGRPALDAPHAREAAVACDIGGLGRPGRDGPEARRHQNAQRGQGARLVRARRRSAADRSTASASPVRGASVSTKCQ